MGKRLAQACQTPRNMRDSGLLPAIERQKQVPPRPTEQTTHSHRGFCLQRNSDPHRNQERRQPQHMGDQIPAWAQLGGGWVHPALHELV